MELLSFYKRVLPTSKSIQKTPTSSVDRMAKTSGYSIQLTADLRRLNLLLMRTQMMGQMVKGVKVATVAIIGGRVRTTMTNGALELKGSIDGMEVVSVLDENKQTVFCVGEEEVMLEETEKACDFELFKDDGEFSSPRLKIHMASLCYIHNPVVLQQVSFCLDQFQEQVRALAAKIKSHAKDYAMSIVKPKSTNMTLDAILETPFIVLPRSPNNSNVLIAQLGNIEMRHDTPLANSTMIDEGIS